MTTTSEFKLIPLAEIHESKHNPRKHFDGPALEQLTDSIRKVGVITPALVRPNAKGFELAAGHRRYRASKALGLDLEKILTAERKPVVQAPAKAAKPLKKKKAA